MHKYDPASIGRDLREGIAHPIAGGAHDRLRLSTFSLIEWNAIQVELNLRLFRVASILRKLGTIRIRILRLRSRKDEVLAIRAPYRVGVHVVRIVGAGQVLQMRRITLVPGQNAAGCVENLQEPIVFEIGDIEIPHEIFRILAALIIGLIDPRVVDRGDHVPRIG